MPRSAAIDHLKAAAILAVLAQHAIPPVWRGFTRGETVLNWAVQYHVPVFLLVSGLLYAPAGLSDPHVLARRLGRVLVPYALATVVMQLTGFARVKSLPGAVLQLLTGSALAIYYYVFLLTVCLLVTAVLTRLGRTIPLLVALALLWLYLVAAALWPALRFRPRLFWEMRNPLYYYGFFVVGWLAAAHAGRLRALARAAPWTICCLCLGGIAGYAAYRFSVGPGTHVVSVMMRSLYTFAVAGLIATLTLARPTSRPVRLLSDATYPIFLYHLPFVLLLRPALERTAAPLRTLALFTAGLAGGTLVTWVGTRLLGERARLLLGTGPVSQGAAGSA